MNDLMYNENAMNFILKLRLAEALSDQPEFGMYVNNEVTWEDGRLAVTLEWA